MYKITKGGKTFVGDNIDCWDANSRMWFENGQSDEMGAVYFGFDNLYPQGAMNEAGLVYGSLNVTPREVPFNKYLLSFDGKKVMRDIMKTCKSVGEVYSKLILYNRTPIGDGMLYFVDQSGDYLIVEVDTMIRGNDSHYVISNFCPSQTPDFSTVDIPFFQSARKMMKAQVDTSLNYLTALSDTLHQSWSNNVGGTQYTLIFNLSEGSFQLFYYHDFKNPIKFNLKTELSRGDRTVSIPDVFPNNALGHAQLTQYTKAHDFIKQVKNTDLAKDSIQLATYIQTEGIGPMINFFQKELYFLGYDFLKADKKESAINLFKLNVKYCPKSWNSYNSLGDIYFDEKDYLKALSYFTRSVELNPEFNENGKSKIKKIKKRIK